MINQSFISPSLMAFRQGALSNRPVQPSLKKLYQRRFFPCLLHLPCLLLVATTFVLTDDPVVTLGVGGAVVIPTYLILAAIEAKRAPTLVSPLSFVFLWQSVGLGASALSIGHRVASHELMLLASFEVTPDDLAIGYLLTLLGSFLFHVGMQIVRPLGLQGVPEQDVHTLGARQYPWLLFLVWASGIVARLLGSPSGPLGAAFGILSWGSNAALCAYALSSPQENAKPRLSWVLLGAGVAVEFVFNAATFSKAYIMYSFVPIVWTAVYFRGLRRWLLVCGAVFISFYFVIVAPVVLSARNEGRLREGETVIGRLLEHYSSKTDIDRESALDHLVWFLERQFDPLAAGFIYREVERYGLRYGETMDYMAYAFIPRFLWPEKPWVTHGAWFSVYLGQGSNEQEATTATAQTAAGELYWNFGVPGVIIGMLVLGTAVGLLWRISGSIPQVDPLRMLLFFSTILVTVDTGEAGGPLVGIIHKILVLGLLIWAWDRRGKPAAAKRTGVLSGLIQFRGLKPTPQAGKGHL